jgi:myo-inositol-1(or 4)-monophosphatase
LRASDADERTALADLLNAAIREAGALALSMFGTQMKTWTKGQGSPVTAADMAVNDLLRERVTAAARGIAWLSEESADEGARLSARRVWIVDPIDGTRAYMAGRTDWAVSAALVEDGRPVLAALFAPAEPAFYAAAAGRGASLDGAPIAVAAGARLEGARVAGPKSYLERLTALGLPIEALPRVHSIALRFARIARGTLDVAFSAGSSHDWDLAAADLLVHEAGGMLTTLAGGPLVYNRAELSHGPLVAAGRARHEKLIEILSSDLEARP